MRAAPQDWSLPPSNSAHCPLRTAEGERLSRPPSPKHAGSLRTCTTIGAAQPPDTVVVIGFRVRAEHCVRLENLDFCLFRAELLLECIDASGELRLYGAKLRTLELQLEAPALLPHAVFRFLFEPCGADENFSAGGIYVGQVDPIFAEDELAH